MDKQQLTKLLKEKQKRGKLNEYKSDFASFAEEQIKIITKDASQGFVPFKLNECQKEKDRAFNRGWNEGVFKIEQDEAIKEGRSTERGRAYIEGRFDRYKLRR